MTLLLSGIVPLVLLMGLDILLGWLPLLTITGLIIFIPLGSFLVVRTALEEFSHIVEQVAPELEDAGLETGEKVETGKETADQVLSHNELS